MGCCPVSVAELEPFRGLNSKTAKASSLVPLPIHLSTDQHAQSMVSSLQHEVSVARLKLLELERAVSCFGTAHFSVLKCRHRTPSWNVCFKSLRPLLSICAGCSGSSLA